LSFILSRKTVSLLSTLIAGSKLGALLFGEIDRHSSSLYNVSRSNQQRCLALKLKSSDQLICILRLTSSIRYAVYATSCSIAHISPRHQQHILLTKDPPKSMIHPARSLNNSRIRIKISLSPDTSSQFLVSCTTSCCGTATESCCRNRHC